MRAENFARGSPVFGCSCLGVPHLLRCWCPYRAGLVPPDCLMSSGSQLGQGWAGLREMTGESENFTRYLPVFGCICIGSHTFLNSGVSHESGKKLVFFS